MPWDNVPEDKWPDMESCVDKVMADGKDKESATAICYESVMGKKKSNRLRALAARLADSIAAAFEAEPALQGGEFTTAGGATINNTHVLNQPAPAATVARDVATMQALAADGGQARALPMQAVYEQVFLAAMKQYPQAYILDLYTEAGSADKSGAMYAVLAQEGKLYRSEITVKDGAVTLSAWQAVEVDFQAAPDGEMRTAADPAPGHARVSLVRQKDGRVRWFSQSCSAVLNRSGEIDGTALFDSFIRHAEETGEYPIRQFYHAGEAFRTGRADWLARDGFVYLTSGLYDDSEIARAEIAARERDPEYWGESIGYDSTKPPIMVEVGGGVRLPMYTEGIHREISTLPEKDAAALFTRTAQEVRRMTLSQRQLDELIHLFGSEEAARKWLEENPEATNRQIMQGALVARAQEAAPPPGAAALATGQAEAAPDNAAEGEDEQADDPEAEAVADGEDQDGDESEDGEGDPETARQAPTLEEVYEVDAEVMTALTDGVIASPAMQNLFASVQSIQATLEAMSRDATAIRMRDSASLAALAERLDSLEESADTQRSIWQDDMPARRRVAVTYRPRHDAPMGEEPALDMAAEAEAVTESFPS